jgi:hypothetical protein
VSTEFTRVPTRRERVAEAAPFALAAAVGLYVARGQELGDQLVMAVGMGIFIPTGALLLILVCEYVTARIIRVGERNRLPDRFRTYAAALAIVAVYGLAQRWQDNQLERLVECIQDEQTTENGRWPVTAATLRWCDQEYHEDDASVDLDV